MKYLLNTFDPLLLLLLGGGGHPVHGVLPLHNLPLAVSLAGFDNLRRCQFTVKPLQYFLKLCYLISGTEKLKAMRFAPVSHFSDL